MAKQITIPYKDEKYTLEFTRRSVEAMERAGFVAGEVLDKPLTGLPALFEGAFMAHHPKLGHQKISEILKEQTNRKALFGALAEMYREPIEELLGGPEDSEDSEGNATWTASW